LVLVPVLSLLLLLIVVVVVVCLPGIISAFVVFLSGSKMARGGSFLQKMRING